MALKSVYRVWVCYGTQNDNSIQVGNPSLQPAVYREEIFGDFSTDVEAAMRISGYLSQWTRNNVNQQVPTFKPIRCTSYETYRRSMISMKCLLLCVLRYQTRVLDKIDREPSPVNCTYIITHIHTHTHIYSLRVRVPPSPKAH